MIGINLGGSLAATHTWTGTNSSLWSDPLNWIGGAPQPGAPGPIDLIIPASAPGFQDLTNDVPGLTVNGLTIAAHANMLHALPGVVLTLQNGALSGLGVSTILAPSFALALEGETQLLGGSDFVVRGPITEGVPGATLSLSGNVWLETSFSHSGPTCFTGGMITLLGSATNTAFLDVATNTHLRIAGDFTVLTNNGWLTIFPECYLRPETSRLYGQGLVCAPGSTSVVSLVDYPAMDSTDPADGSRLHSRLMIDGPVVLAGRLEATTDLRQDGLRYAIIENSGSHPTLGQFDELPEGALMTVADIDLLTQRLSYRGGTGKDVTATFIVPPAGRQLTGPFPLENGWIQILAGIDELEILQSYRWEANDDLALTNGWMALGPDFVPSEDGPLLTITNVSSSPHPFYRLKQLPP